MPAPGLAAKHISDEQRQNDHRPEMRWEGRDPIGPEVAFDIGRKPRLPDRLDDRRVGSELIEEANTLLLPVAFVFFVQVA